MKRRQLAAMALPYLAMAGAASCSAGTHAWARPEPDPALRRTGRLMQLSVVDRDTGRELPLYFHQGDYWVAGVPGSRYALRVHNRQRGRLLAVMSVDGVNVVTGERAGVLQNGYVLDGGERADIAGWRKSDAQVAAFEFTAPDEAYATRTGRPEHLGVIGVAVFQERTPRPAPPPSPPVLREQAPASRANGAGESAADASAPADARADRGTARVAPAPQLGTGHGRREDAPVSRTQFVRARGAPDEVLRVRYDSHANLVARGVLPGRRAPHSSPSAFPASPEAAGGYVPDPPARW